MEATALGIHGFGRIGRSLFRAATSSDLAVRVVNDRLPSDENLRYLLRFDSIYGRFPLTVVPGPGSWIVGGTPVARFGASRLDEVPWRAEGVDIVIDASGVGTAAEYEAVLATGASAIVATRRHPNAPTVIAGVNEVAAGRAGHRVVGASTCDGNALALLLAALDRFGVAEGTVTTLHPWLAYQHLVDAPIDADYPAEYADAFDMGRAAPSSLIPKHTSVLAAINDVFPDLTSRLAAHSFRTPMHAVCSLDVTLRLAANPPPTAEEVNDALGEAATRSDGAFTCTDEQIVSIDALGVPTGAIVDTRWTQVVGSLVKVVAWYDNEAGYSSQVLRVVRTLAAALPPAERAPIS